MFTKLRRYRVHGRTIHKNFDHDHQRQHTSRPTELLVSAFDQPPDYPSGLRLDFGDQDYDGGWIKLPQSESLKISRLLATSSPKETIVCTKQGACIEALPNKNELHDEQDVRDVTLKIRKLQRKTGNAGCELRLGLHELSGANIILTPAQTEDLRILINRRQNDFENIQNNDPPITINPDGTEP